MRLPEWRAGRCGQMRRMTKGQSRLRTGQENSAGDTVIEFENVQFCYQGAGADSLTDISFSVRRGETVGIIGGTGAGKTSLVSLIPRFYDVREGCVKIGGIDVRAYRLKSSGAWSAWSCRNRSCFRGRSAAICCGGMRRRRTMTCAGRCASAGGGCRIR